VASQKSGENSSEVQMVLKERASSGQVNNSYSWPAVFQWIGFKEVAVGCRLLGFFRMNFTFTNL